MKITDLQLVYAKHYLFVKIYTDAGIVGLGEAGNWGFLNATAAAIEKFKPYLVGKDPFRIEDICQNLYRAQYFRGSVIMSAISAVDIALWDIKGKAFGVPVYELLGGRVRDKVRVYASVMTKEDDPHALAEAHDVLVIPHNPLGPVSTAACLQICACIPNLGIQELPGFCLNDAEDAMVKQPLRFENGCMILPDAPGIGVELADNATELYPPKERSSNEARRAFDGSVKDW